MRHSYSITALAAAGIVVLAVALPAGATTTRLAGTVRPGAEIVLTPGLTPTAPYRGVVLVQLVQNPAPVDIRIGTCQGKPLGAVSIPAHDHAPHIAAIAPSSPPCIRYRVKNPGTTPVTIAGFGYF
jgi:hypothetical protein